MEKLFLPVDQEKATKELNCYGYCLEKSMELKMQGHFEKAALYLENASRSLRMLERMKKDKEAYDKTWFLLKQIDSERQQKQLLYKMRVNIYE